MATGPDATWGGGMVNYHGSSPTIINCILWGNKAPNGAGISNDDTSSAAVTYSDVQDYSNSTPDANGNFAADPLFVDADGADGIPGTPDDDLHLLPGSPCINTGSNAAIQATGVTIDLDGNPRISNGKVDLGAYETTSSNHAPLANAGNDQNLPVTGLTTPVTLNGSASYDPDGDSLTYAWTEGSAVLATTVNPTVNLAPGIHTLTLTVTDPFGLSASDDVIVTLTYAWSGFLQPINADGSSVFKAGSTVPVKFALTGASAGITNAVAKLSYALVSGGTAGSVNEAVSTAAGDGGNLFRYDPTSQQYLFNWSTKVLSVGTYQISVDLGDGVSRTVNVGLR